MAAIMELSHAVKNHPEDFRHALDARQMVLFFEKASLRTRLTFEAAINTLGGNAIFVDQTQSPLGERESLPDMAHNIERWMSIMVLRTYSHDTITEMAACSRIPVINALSDLEHPCQAIADFFTLEERFGSAQGLRFTYVGDGNNVCHSLMLTAAQLGVHCTVASPKGFAPKLEIIHKAIEIAEQTGGSITLMQDPVKAVTGADAIYTDVCTSMGFEHEAPEARADLQAVPGERGADGARAAARGVYALPAGPPQRRGDGCGARWPAVAGLRAGGEPHARAEGAAADAAGRGQTHLQRTRPRRPGPEAHMKQRVSCKSAPGHPSRLASLLTRALERAASPCP
jgi:ornithine carbamoyltransferase